MKNQLNPKDITIISHLREDSRKSLTEISKDTCIPISTIYTKMIGYRGEVIRKHTSILNFEALGYHTIVLLFFSCESSESGQLLATLSKSPSINSVFKLNNDYQVMCEGVFRYVADVDEFVEGLEKRFKITKRKVFYIAKELMREGFMSEPTLIAADKERCGA